MIEDDIMPCFYRTTDNKKKTMLKVLFICHGTSKDYCYV